MIIRVAHNTHFTVVRNKTIRDSRLSFKARGVLVYLLSLPDDTLMSREHLAHVSPDGVYAIRTALQELRTAGYLDYERRQDEYGRWSTEAIIRECPRGQEPKAGNPPSDMQEPTADFRPVGLKDQGGGLDSSSRPPLEGTCAVCGDHATSTFSDRGWLCSDHLFDALEASWDHETNRPRDDV